MTGGADLPPEDEIRDHATSLSSVYKVAYVAASGEVAGAVGSPGILMAAHEIALMTVRYFHELQTVSARKFEEEFG